LTAAFAVLVLSLGAQQPSRVPAHPRQGWVAGQFLKAVLRADYPAAYRYLAPEVRRSVSLSRFKVVARPLWQSGQRRGQRIELYKLGMRLGEGGPAQLFYDFSFASDSSQKPPARLLEVTFRDTASRVVLGFDVRNTRAATTKPATQKQSTRK
jgi:hypothetical protein